MRRFFIIATLLWAGSVSAEEPPITPNAPPPATPSATPLESTGSSQYNTVLLQGLNKVTGHLSRLEGPMGTVMRFGNLEIIARRCWKSNPDESPENAVLLEIRKLKPGEVPARIFLGWMFSSSPGLSGLEDPVYDVTMLACENHADPETKTEN